MLKIVNAIKGLLNISLPIKLVLVILLAGLFQNNISNETASMFYTVSIMLKEFIIFMLPFIIVSSIYKSLTGLRDVPIAIIPLLLAFICISNFSNVIFSSNLATYLIDETISVNNIELSSAIFPIFNFSIIKLMSNDKALLIGFILGLIGFYQNIKILDKSLNKLHTVSNYILRKVFIPLLPFFIFGFVLKAFKDNVFAIIIDNMVIFGDIILLLLSYQVVLYLIAAKFNFRTLVTILRNVFTPVLTAFTTMSSAVALPFSLRATEENTKNKALTRFFINGSANIHMIGDSLSIPILAVLVCHIFNVEFDPSKILLFSTLFTLAKFSGAGIPGGSVLIMAPVMESVYGFNSEMIGLITTLYIVIDPFTSSSNVGANNAYAIILDNIVEFSRKIRTKFTEVKSTIAN